MLLPSVEKIKNTYWYSYSDSPIATRGVLKLCDPAYLLPEETPDGYWHMFAHTWLGLEHFVSTSGLEWERKRLIFLRGHSPFVYKEGNTYYLLYESHDMAFINKEKDNNINASRIMVSTSTDLSLWSDPRVILDSTKITRAQYKDGPVRVSRPELICVNGKYRLYFGAGETRIYDSKQKATARLMYAEADSLESTFVVNPKPILEIEPDSALCNLAVGAVKIVPCSDGIAAFECAYAYNREKNKSETNLILRLSSDGINFSDGVVIQSTPEEGWASRYITSVDVRYKENEDTWYCYYSANNRKKGLLYTYIRESLGLLLGAQKTK